MSELLKDNGDFRVDRRGVISNGQALDHADAMGLSPAMLDTRKIVQAFSAEQIVAATKLMIENAKVVNEAAKSGDVNIFLEARERQKMIQGHVRFATSAAMAATPRPISRSVMTSGGVRRSADSPEIPVRTRRT